MNDGHGVLFDKAQSALLRFPARSGLKTYTIPAGVTDIGVRAFDGCSELTSVIIPDGVTGIGNRAFQGCSGLTSIGIPASVTTMGSAALESPFYFMSSLDTIVFTHGITNIPAHAFDIMNRTFSKRVNVYIPPTVESVDIAAFSSPAPGNMTIRGLTDSFIETWANTNGVPFESVNAWITKDDYEDAWRLVPYQYIIETNAPENAGLSFEIVGGNLPAGLSLLQDGRFHGAPLEIGVFTFHVAVRFNRFGEDNKYLMDLQEIKLRVEEPDDAMLAASNHYEVFDFVGEPAVLGIERDYILIGDYAPGGLADQTFEAADSPEDEAASLSNYRYFADFWLDGEPLVRNVAYEARGGSTVVTVYAKTFQNLDNGPHTIAAEFMIKEDPAGAPLVPPVQKVSAQKFTLALTGEKPSAPPSDTPPDGVPSNPSGDDSSGGTTPPAPQAPQTTAEPQTPVAWQNPFGDVRESDWFYADVVYVCENGLMNGTSGATFSPNAPMSRGMLVTVLHRAAGSPAPEGGQDAFSDVPANAYYADAAAWAAESGLASGTGAGAFAPDTDITRADLATLIARYADRAGMELPAVRPHAAFADETLTPDYARDAVRTLAEGGVLNGKPGNRFDPAGQATRAEVAAILHRFLDAAF
jgi:hypothetical protein